MPEEEDDGEKKGGKDKKAGKDDTKCGKDDKGGKDKKAKEKSPKSTKSPSKASSKGSPKPDKKADASKEKIDKPEKSQAFEMPEEHKQKSIEKVVKKQMGPYKAPPPSETMLRAMAETAPVYAERFYNDSYEDEQEGRNYVEVQMYERRSGTNINERQAGAPSGGQKYYVNVPPPRPPRPPPYDEYYEERHHSRRDQLDRPSMSQMQMQMMYFDDGGNMSNRQEASFYDYQDMPPAEPVPQQESRRAIVLPPTTVVVNLTEGGPPTAGVGGSSALVGARSSGYDMPQRLQGRRASLRTQEDLKMPSHLQQSDLQVRNAPTMTTPLTQQMRNIAMQNQMPLDDNVVSSTERVIYEVIRKMQSSESIERSDQQVERFERLQRPALRPSGPISAAMSPVSAPRLMSPPGMMSPGMRAPPVAMMRSPMVMGSRCYLPRTPYGPMRPVSPWMAARYPPPWRSPIRLFSSFSPPPRGRPDNSMSLLPERSLVMLLILLFLFVLIVVIVAIAGMNIPGFGKNRDRY